MLGGISVFLALNAISLQKKNTHLNMFCKLPLGPRGTKRSLNLACSNG